MKSFARMAVALVVLGFSRVIPAATVTGSYDMNANTNRSSGGFTDYYSGLLSYSKVDGYYDDPSIAGAPTYMNVQVNGFNVPPPGPTVVPNYGDLHASVSAYDDSNQLLSYPFKPTAGGDITVATSGYLIRETIPTALYSLYPIYSYLDATFTMEGFAVAGDNLNNSAGVSAELIGGNGDITSNPSDQVKVVAGPGDSLAFAHLLSIFLHGTMQPTQDPNTVTFVFELNARLTAYAQANGGYSIANALDTLKFDSLTFQDGTTPESHGFQLTFDPGFTSPNLRPASETPEPSSLILLASGAVATMASGTRFCRKPFPRRKTI